MKLSVLCSILTLLHGSTEGLTRTELALRLGLTLEEVDEAIDLASASPYSFPIYTSDADCAEEEGPVLPDSDAEERLYMLQQGRHIYPQMSLTLEESAALLAVLKSGDGNDPLSRGILAGIGNLLASSSTDRLTKGADHLYSRSDTGGVRATVEGALLNEQMLYLVYRPSSGAEISTGLYPLGLVRDSSSGFEYLLAATSLSEAGLSPQLFRLDRIAGIRTGARFVYPPHFSLHEFLKPFWSMEISTPVEVRVRFYDEANVVRKARQMLAVRCPPGRLEALPDGSIVYSGSVAGIEAFRAWLRGLGSSVEVLAPDWLRKQMIESARKLYNLYEDDKPEGNVLR